MKAVLLISHGSRSHKTESEILTLINIIVSRCPEAIVKHAFLEIAQPNIPDGIDSCVEHGATEIIILLNFLNSGKHVDVDIPEIINQAKIKHPKVQFQITKPIGQHEGIADLFLDYIQ